MSPEKFPGPCVANTYSPERSSSTISSFPEITTKKALLARPPQTGSLLCELPSRGAVWPDAVNLSGSKHSIRIVGVMFDGSFDSVTYLFLSNCRRRSSFDYYLYQPDSRRLLIWQPRLPTSSRESRASRTAGSTPMLTPRSINGMHRLRDAIIPSNASR